MTHGQAAATKVVATVIVWALPPHDDGYYSSYLSTKNGDRGTHVTKTVQSQAYKGRWMLSEQAAWEVVAAVEAIRKVDPAQELDSVLVLVPVPDKDRVQEELVLLEAGEPAQAAQVVPAIQPAQASLTRAWAATATFFHQRATTTAAASTAQAAALSLATISLAVAIMPTPTLIAAAPITIQMAR